LDILPQFVGSRNSDKQRMLFITNRCSKDGDKSLTSFYEVPAVMTARQPSIDRQDKAGNCAAARGTFRHSLSRNCDLHQISRAKQSTDASRARDFSDNVWEIVYI
jgi:hypothetical protein